MSGKKNQTRIAKTPLTTSTPKQRLSFSSVRKSPITAKLPEGKTTRDVSPVVTLRNSTLTASGSKEHGQTPSRIQEKQTKREIKLLQEENKELKAELLYIKSLYKQLIDEAPQEKFDERRVNLLKSQVIQLERQVVLLSSALNSRTDMLTEVEGQLIKVKSQLSVLMESHSPNHNLCESLTDLMQTIEGMRWYLYKTAEDTNPDRHQLPAMLMGKFLKNSKETGSEVSLVDVCSGKLDHINLKHVSKLESKLCKIYKKMVCLQEILNPNNTMTSYSEHVGQPIRERLADHATTTTDLLQETCQDLLSLSILVPAAPWPPLRKPIRADLTLENVMAHMPSGLSRKKEQEIHSVLDALMKAASYSQHMLALEVKILKEELSFHQKVYEVQVDYAESLLEAVRTAYTQFEKSTLEMLCKPLDGILESYETLKSTTSEEALRDFLTQFKENSEKLTDAVECLQSHATTSSEGQSADADDALSQYGQHFFDSLNVLTKECTSKRDSLMSEIMKLKTAEEQNKSTKQSNSPQMTPMQDSLELSTKTSPQS